MLRIHAAAVVGPSWIRRFNGPRGGSRHGLDKTNETPVSHVIRVYDLRVMGPETCFFVTFFKSTIYVFLSVAQGLNEIVMMITDFATVAVRCKGKFYVACLRTTRPAKC
jgi:hypothetical protein